jgi:hypothetical protein
MFLRHARGLSSYLEHERLEALDKDEAGRRKSLEDEVGAWLPFGATVKMTTSDGWSASEEPLLAAFSVEIPNLASLAGKRLVVPASLLSSQRKRIFTSNTRVYPVDLGYPASQSDELKLQLPEGYTLEEPPSPRKIQLSWGGYEFSSAVEGSQLVVNRTLRLDKSFFPAEDYAQLQTLFNIVQAGDASQAVLQPKQAAAVGTRE